MSRFHVGQLVIAVMGQYHTELLGRLGTVTKVGHECFKPFCPGETTPGLIVDVADHGPISGAYACWMPVDDYRPDSSDLQDEELPEELLA